MIVNVTTVLWDIDGTLLRTPGFGVRAFDRALVLVSGRSIPRDRPYDFGGKTDPLIAVELLDAVGLLHRSEELVPVMLAEVELAYAEDVDQLCTTIRVLPGVPELLAAWHERGTHQSVVTGNLEYVARCKLAAGALDAHLDLASGGYGSDHPERVELVRLAMARSARTVPIECSTTWIIGDTPRDASCAAAAGVRCLLVATGTYPVDALMGLGADAVLTDLTDTGHVLSLVADPGLIHDDRVGR